MRHDKNPHLTYEGADHVTGHRHCFRCAALLHTRYTTVADHVATSWTHYRWSKTPEVIATHPKTGHTLEGVIAVPSRRVLAQVPLFTYLAFCPGCYHNHLKGEGCGGCGKPVRLEDAHSVSEVLHKNASGHHHSFSTVLWHPTCLPTALSVVNRQETK